MTATAPAARDVAGGLLEIRDLSVAYGPIRAVRGVSLVARPGAVTAVLGPNGAGKTTLLRAVSGLVPVAAGHVLLDGADLTGRPPEQIVRHGIAHVPEGRGVIGELTVEENLRLGALWRRDRRGTLASLEEAFGIFPVLEGRRRAPAASLSGGEQQMLAIARALMARPRVLLLDEPSLGLAPLVTAQVMEVLRRLTRERSLSVLLVEQNVRSALAVASRVVALSLGRVVLDDDASRVPEDAELLQRLLGLSDETVRP
jgi:branched-chain amino acid transport system ATP-binding protein